MADVAVYGGSRQARPRRSIASGGRGRGFDLEGLFGCLHPIWAKVPPFSENKFFAKMNSQPKSSLVIIHGGPGLDSEYLRESLGFLSDAYKLLFYDQIGCGSGSAADAKVSIKALHEQLESIISEALIQGPVSILAHSWGAVLAYEFLLTHGKDGIRDLIMLSPVGPTRSDFDDSGNRLIERIPSSILEGISDGKMAGPDIMKAIYPYYCADRTRAMNTETVPNYYSDAYEQTLADLGDYNYSDLAGKMPARTILIYGDHDIEDPSVTRPLKEDAILVILKGCGHFSPLEDAKSLKDAIWNHLSPF